MSHKVTRCKRSICRVETTRDEADPNDLSDLQGEISDLRYGEASCAEARASNVTLSRREKGKKVIRALGKALKMTITSDNEAAPPQPPSRGSSSRATTAPSSPAPTAPSSARAEYRAMRTHSRQGSASSLSPRNSLYGADLTSHSSNTASGAKSAQRLRRTSSVQSMHSIVTTCTSHAELSEGDSWAANVPKRPLVESLQLFMRYSSAAYGQHFLRILGLGKNRGLNFQFTNSQSRESRRERFLNTRHMLTTL